MRIQVGTVEEDCLKAARVAERVERRRSAARWYWGELRECEFEIACRLDMS